MTGQSARPSGSGWKLKGGSWRQRWRRSRRSWGWRREVCCGAEPPTGPAPRALPPLPPRLWAQDRPRLRPCAQTLKLPVQSKGHTERGEGWVTYLPTQPRTIIIKIITLSVIVELSLASGWNYLKIHLLPLCITSFFTFFWYELQGKDRRWNKAVLTILCALKPGVPRSPAPPWCPQWLPCFWMRIYQMALVWSRAPSSSSTGRWRTLATSAGPRTPRYLTQKHVCRLEFVRGGNSFVVCFSLQLKFMWGNLTLGSREQKEVAVPFLQPGQVGVVSVAFVAPLLEGTYTSHWRLAHCGVQFGPRVWCSIVVVPSSGQKLSSHCSKSLVRFPNIALFSFDRMLQHS